MTYFLCAYVCVCVCACVYAFAKAFTVKICCSTFLRTTMCVVFRMLMFRSLCENIGNYIIPA